MRRLLALAGATLCVAACGAEAYDPGSRPSDRAVTPDGAVTRDGAERTAAPAPDAMLDKPPPVVVRAGEASVELEAWTTCWTNYCSDGAPPDDPPSLGMVGGDLSVEFPLDGWSFSGAAHGADGRCGLSIPIELVPNTDNRWTVAFPGPAGAYEVDLSGRGPEGDVAVTLALSTAVDGPMPGPTADLGFVYLVGDQPFVSGPPTLDLALLADPAATATARVVIVASDGHRTDLELAPTATECARAGSLHLTVGGTPEVERVEETEAASTFGPPPYDVTVDLQLGATTHVGRGAFPADADVETGALRLAFDPPLPPASAAAYAPFAD